MSIKLKTNDEHVYIIKIDIIKVSRMIETMLEDLGTEGLDDEIIPLPNVDNVTLKVVVEWAVHHYLYPHVVNEITERADYICDWDYQFFQRIDRNILYHLIAAANYLDIPELFDAACKFIAVKSKGNSEHEIREYFKLPPLIEDESEATTSNSETEQDSAKDSK